MGLSTRPAATVSDAGGSLKPPRYSDGTQTRNRSGDWVPSVPLPLLLRLRNRCSCGRKFWTMAGYRGHYALAHILDLGDNR